MLPRNIRIKNIGPYQDQSVDLASIPGGLVAITGLNGAGKTMFMESIYAGIYREFPTRPEGIYKFCTERSAGIELEFEMGGKIYRSIVNIDSKNRKMEAVLAHEKIPLNDGKTGTFDEQIVKILGSKDQVLASSYGAQDKKGNFTELAKSKRKDLFIQMIGLQLLQGISDCASKKASDLESQKCTLSGQVDVLHQTADKTLPDVEALRAALAAKRDEHTGLQATLDDLSRALVIEGQKYSQLPDLKSEMESLSAKISSLADEERVICEKLKSAQDSIPLSLTAISSLDSSRRLLKEQRERVIILRQSIDTLPSMKAKGQSLKENLDKKLAEWSNLQAQITHQQSLASSLMALRIKGQELDIIKTSQEEDSSSLRQVSTELVRLSQEESGRRQAMMEMDNKIATAVRDEEEAIKQLELARASSKALKEVPCRGEGEYSGCPLIKTAVESSAKIDELTARVDNCKIVLLALRQEAESLPRPDDAGKKKIVARAEELTKSIGSARVEIERLRIEIANLPAAEAANGQIVTLTPIVETAVVSSQEARKDYAAQEAMIKTTEALKSECSLLEMGIPVLETKIVQYEAIIASAQQASAIIPSLESELYRNCNDAQGYKNRTLELSAAISLLESGRIQYESDKTLWNATKNITLPALLAEIDAIQRQIASGENEASVILAAQSKLKEAESSLGVITYRMSCYSRVSKSFGPMEIQSFEIDSAGPEVSRLSNELLFTCFGPRFSIKFITQELKVDGKGYKDEFDVSVDDQETGKTVSISDLSGGEKTIVSEALALGIALYNKEKSGIAWSTLFRDEVSGTLDDIYAPQYINMLRAARDIGHFQKVYFICHQPRLKEMADNRIVVSKGEISVE